MERLFFSAHIPTCPYYYLTRLKDLCVELYCVSRTRIRVESTVVCKHNARPGTRCLCLSSRLHRDYASINSVITYYYFLTRVTTLIAPIDRSFLFIVTLSISDEREKRSATLCPANVCTPLAQRDRESAPLVKIVNRDTRAIDFIESLVNRSKRHPTLPRPAPVPTHRDFVYYIIRVSRRVLSASEIGSVA